MKYTVFACKDGKGEYREIETEREYKHDDIIEQNGESLFIIREYSEDEFIIWGIMKMLQDTNYSHPPIECVGWDDEKHELTFRVKNGEYYSYTITRNEV